MLVAMFKIALADFVGDHSAHDHVLRKGGHNVPEFLQPAQAQATVRARNGRVSGTDDPRAEAKVQPGGPVPVDDARQQASRIPRKRRASVEIQPIRAPEQPWPWTHRW